MKYKCKHCGIEMTTNAKSGYCSLSCLKSEARELKNEYWEIIRTIKTFES